MPALPRSSKIGSPGSLMGAYANQPNPDTFLAQLQVPSDTGRLGIALCAMHFAHLSSAPRCTTALAGIAWTPLILGEN